MPRKNLYIPKADAGVWEEAEELLARRRGRSVSGRRISAVVTELLRDYVEKEKRKEQGMGPIELNLGTVHAPRKVRFEGRWLVEPNPDATTPDDPAGAAGSYFGVAVTRGGNVAVYIDSTKPSVDARLDTYLSLDAAMEGLPRKIYEMARAEIGYDYVEELDI